MSIKFRNYINQAGITEDYFAEYTYTRWDWMATHGYLDKSAVMFQKA